MFWFYVLAPAFFVAVMMGNAYQLGRREASPMLREAQEQTKKAQEQTHQTLDRVDTILKEWRQTTASLEEATAMIRRYQDERGCFAPLVK